MGYRILTTCIGLFLLISTAKTQDHHVLLTIKEDDVFTYSGDSLIIDKLIMEDNSTLRLSQDSYVEIKSSFIGKKTTISAEGTSGIKGKRGSQFQMDGEDGSEGSKGSDIHLRIHFNELGSLRISTNGGAGGPGGAGYTPERNPASGARGFDGGNGGEGGNGGDGGNLTLLYSYDKVVPRFNRKGKQSVHIATNAGTCGNRGPAGRGGLGGREEIRRNPTTGEITYQRAAGANGQSGLLGSVCAQPGKKGDLVLKRIAK